MRVTGRPPVIFLGILTHRRAGYCSRVVNAVQEHLAGVVDRVAVWHDDDTPAEYAPVRRRVLDAGWTWTHSLRPWGIARAKNRLLTHGLSAGADWLFIAEDDVVPLSPDAILGYVAAAEAAGVDHLSFHAHGPANRVPLRVDGPLTFWPAAVGAWCLYSAGALATVGLMDEGFSPFNVYEHVELTVRLGAAGFSSAWPEVADATGSEAWLAEIPGSIDSSTIRSNPEWRLNRTRARQYWRRAHPDSYRAVFPHDEAREVSG